jgi:23S rRNA (pseudouridine1915-N3)-methyltransferase
VKLVIVAVGQRLPAWAELACNEFCKRMGDDLRLEIKAVKAEARDGRTAAQLMAQERGRIQAAIKAACGRDVHLVALDERGQAPSTMELAGKLRHWQVQGRDVALAIGGTDGLDPLFKRVAHESISLSNLTLPHAMARVLLVEQLYRAWSINNQHPYHRE